MAISLSVHLRNERCPDRVNFNSIGSKKSLYLNHILASFENFHRLKIGVNYNIVKRIYVRAKNVILWNFVSHKKKSKITLAMRHLQDNFQIALDYMHLQKTDNSIEYAKICERNLYLQVKIEDDEDYSSWLRKLENLDHLKRTRIFNQSL